MKRYVEQWLKLSVCFLFLFLRTFIFFTSVFFVFPFFINDYLSGDFLWSVTDLSPSGIVRRASNWNLFLPTLLHIQDKHYRLNLIKKIHIKRNLIKQLKIKPLNYITIILLFKHSLGKFLCNLSILNLYFYKLNWDGVN